MQPTGKRVNARDVFDKMVDGAWKSGDPGIIFIDRINNSPSNPTPAPGPNRKHEPLRRTAVVAQRTVQPGVHQPLQLCGR
jgi:ribonucleotide reductase alpha subunit